ncbi:predicted protein [Botrytis cinerea T4]|uniref:Uncharacterized protein n=1 Tax=Botryotinia fuckeliana (strain T4) TaxID=999810 RepID=G2YJC3_BOTF4|nr:predicted protein [Botrytis cinerea T4]
MPTLFPCMGGLLEDKRQENIKQSRHIEYSYDTNDLLVIFKRERCPGIKLSARKTLFCTFRFYDIGRVSLVLILTATIQLSRYMTRHVCLCFS